MFSRSYQIANQLFRIFGSILISFIQRIEFKASITFRASLTKLLIIPSHLLVLPILTSKYSKGKNYLIFYRRSLTLTEWSRQSIAGTNTACTSRVTQHPSVENNGKPSQRLYILQDSEHALENPKITYFSVRKRDTRM